MANKKGGKGYKKSKKNDKEKESRELIIKEGDQQEYAKVTKNLGDRRMLLKCFDGLERVGRVRGKMRKKRGCWISVGDYVLITLRDLENELVVGSAENKVSSDKADIIHLYNADEVRTMRNNPNVYKFDEPQERDVVTNQLIVDEEEDCAFDIDDL